MLRVRQIRLLILSALLVLRGSPITLAQPLAESKTNITAGLSVMSWNIWHGGRQDGEEAGPKRVAEVIKASGADIVAVQETYGSGELLAKSLAFNLHDRGTNVSILSRWPIEEDISVFEPFKCAGAIIRLPSGQRIAMYSIWLPYGDDIWLPEVRTGATVGEWLAACRPSAIDLRKIFAEIKQRLGGERYADVDVLIAGDFNSMSHLDYTEMNTDMFVSPVDWETSHVLLDAGFKDSFREVNPIAVREKDSTWSPRFGDQEQERIDYIYYESTRLQCVESKVVSNHPVRFPSDHAAVISRFAPAAPPEKFTLRAASYNIRHGQGMDAKLLLERTARAISELDASIVALQEVDMNVDRSGSVNEMRLLGKSLGMHAAFGSFMRYGDGKYGLGILSQYPFQNVETLSLSTGNEPRVALLATVILPGGKTVTVVCLHFDWVREDGFRYQQATEVVESLKSISTPIVVLGDFNDQPDSRTLSLFRESFIEADKPEDDRFTWPASKPSSEIDFIFFDKQSGWDCGNVKVVDEAIASDHRPIIATLGLLANPPK